MSVISFATKLLYLSMISHTPNDITFVRLRCPLVTHERHTRALRVPVGDIGREVVKATCRSAVLGRRGQCSGKRRHHRRDDVVQSEREVTVSAQSQVSSTVSTVSRCTRQQWTATCPPRYRRPTTRFDNTINTFITQ